MNETLPAKIERVCPVCKNQFLAKRYKVLQGLDNFCGRKCRNHGWESPEVRFWKQVRKTDKCWVWTGPVHTYGRIYANGAYWMSHRFSWFIHNGPIPNGKYVCHRCDNPPCVRPDHLFLGDALENHQDCVKKNRQVFGERNGRCKLTEAQAIQVKRLYESGDWRQVDLAEKFGVTQIAISLLVRGVNWKYLNHLKYSNEQ
jgi:hypothetical protein